MGTASHMVSGGAAVGITKGLEEGECERTKRHGRGGQRRAKYVS